MTPFTYTMGTTLVRMNSEGKPYPIGDAPPYPMLTGPGFQFTPKRRKPRTEKAHTAPVHAAPAAPAPIPVPVPTTTAEEAMPKTTTTEKIEKINAYLKGANQPTLGAIAAEELLKAHSMSPKRVIRHLKEAAPATAPATNHLHDAVKPAAPAAPDKPADPVAAVIAAKAKPAAKPRKAKGEAVTH